MSEVALFNNHFDTKKDTIYQILLWNTYFYRNFQNVYNLGSIIRYFFFFFTNWCYIFLRAWGPMTLSPTGQLLVPSSCPPPHLISFISDNLHSAPKLLDVYNR